ncbi:hypothetical protein [Paenibacillus sanguinis]|uniref:hypothetical protein n=1 Tax=Paenibacillus sanguinis TaxID=225906 RepID=UPI000375B2DB|nr:hypothetical protein [Paenibacillus sanguinis]
MTNKIRIKLGLIEFEAEGDSELIEREREQFFSLLPTAISAVSPIVSPSPQILEMVQDITGASDTPALTNTSSNNNIISYDSIAAFLKIKSFSKEVERVLGVAYFLDQIEGISPFTVKDIEAKYTDARISKPKNISDAINKNITKGYLGETKEKKDGLKSFYVLTSGIEWCQDYTPSETTTPVKKSPKSRKVASESSLLNISLDELNLEKYGDVSSLEKFIDQLLVVMLIYSREKGIEYFSYEDIVAVFKNKFRLPATERQVQYSFDKGGTMFDKKIEKKRAFHKLLSSGIKEAERIVAQHNI